MATNLVNTTNSKALISMGTKIDGGLKKAGASVPVTMVTQSKFAADLTAFKSKEEDFGIARQALDSAYGLYTVASQAVTDWLGAARPVFVGHFGTRWSAQWAAAGWVNATTAIPDTIDDRFVLAGAVASFLTKNPSFEVAATGVTAANGETILEIALMEQGAVADADQALKDADVAREPARDLLVSDIRAVIKNLSGLLSKNDPRWVAFGLNQPGSKTTPDKPTGLAAMVDALSGGLILTCDAQPLAERFRWRGRENGMPYQLLARSTAPVGKTRPFAPGTTLELIVQAVNGGSQSVPSDSIFFTVPLPAASTAPEATAPATERTTSARSNGNGSNGQANGRRSMAQLS